MTKDTICHVCGNKYTNLEIDYCMGCGAVIGKKRAEYLGETITRWDKIREKISGIHWSKMIVMPYYDLNISRPRFSKKIYDKIEDEFSTFAKWVRSFMGRLMPGFDHFTEEWRNHVKLPPHERKVDDRWIQVAEQHLGRPLPRKLSDVVLADHDTDMVTNPIHGKDMVVIIKVAGKEHRIDHVTNFNMSTTRGDTGVTTMDSDYIQNFAGPTKTEVSLDVLIGSVTNHNFWQSLIGIEAELLIVDARYGYRHEMKGTGISFRTMGKVGEFTTTQFVFLVRENHYVNYVEQQAQHIAANMLIERLEADYPFLTMEDHPCDNYNMWWEEVGNHVVCALCGSMMVRNLPELPPANPMAVVLGEDTRPYSHNSPLAASDLIKNAAAVKHMREKVKDMQENGAVPVAFMQRASPVVTKPSAAVKLKDLHFQYDEV